MEGTPLSYSKAANRKGHITLTLALTRMPTGLWRQHFYSNWTCDKVCSPGPYFSLTCAAFCSLKSVLNFGFGLRPWSSPPAVALANFFIELVESGKKHSAILQFALSFCVCWRARHLSPVAFRYSFMEGTPLSYSNQNLLNDLARGTNVRSEAHNHSQLLSHGFV